MKRTHKSKSIWWTMPLLLVLPVVAAAAAIVLIWGGKIADLFTVALKMAVIP